MSTGKHKNSKKKPGVLAGHQRKGKKFIPPMMQFDISEARWIKTMVPEFIWIALLQDSLGYAQGAEVARKTAELAREIEGANITWGAELSAFARLPDARKEQLTDAISSAGVGADLERGLAPLQRFYPTHPLAFALSTNAPDVALHEYKRILADLFRRTNTSAMRVQATALYLAFDAGFLKVAPNTTLADFPKVQHYPGTERSRQVAAAVRAGLNAISIQIAGAQWPDFFWNRGLELEPCELRRVDDDDE